MYNAITSIDTDKAHKAAESLWAAFTWDMSPEGHDYWSDVVRKLEHIANTGEFLKEE